MLVLRLLLVASLALSATGKRVVDQEKMQTTTQTTTTNTPGMAPTNVTADPLAPLFLQTEGLLASPANGCALHGWHGEYNTVTGAAAITVDVYPRSTTFKFSSARFETSKAKDPEMLNRLNKMDGQVRTEKNGDVVFTHKTSELAEKFCSAPSMYGAAFGELCDFFSPGHIQKFCTKQAGKKIGAVAKMPFTAAHAGYTSVKNYLFGSK
ncbi:unnamed protein product [Symbiodinium sp. CCMP2592]|nr:unnamed protein product [Symbiodinium sp. CCMP2592]